MESSLNEDKDNNNGEQKQEEASPGLSAFLEANLRAPNVPTGGNTACDPSGGTAGAGGAGLPSANALRQYIEDMSRNTNSVQLPALASPGSMLGQGGDHDDSAIAAAGLDSASLGAGLGPYQGLTGQNLLGGGLPNNIASALGVGGQQQQLPTGLQLQQLLASSGYSNMATNPLGGLPSLNVSSLTNNRILLGGEQNLNALSSLQQQPQLGASIPGTGMLTGGANLSHLLPGLQQQNTTTPLAQQDFLNTLLQQSQEGQQGGAAAAAAALLANQQAVAPLTAPTPASLMALGGSNLLGSLMQQQQQAAGGVGGLLAGMASAGGVTPNATGAGNLPPSLLAQLSAGTLPSAAGEATATAATGGIGQQQQGTLSQIQPSQIAVSVGQQQQLEAAAAASGGAAAVAARPKKPKKHFKREDIPEDKEYEKYVSDLPEVVRDRRIYRHEAFPDKLYRMLEEAEDNGLDHIICFTESGTAFRVINTRIFERVVGPQYFRHNKYSSFRRQLSTYGFQRVDEGPDCGAFSHKLFRRGRPELLPKILRLSEIKELEKQQQQEAEKEDEEGEKPPATTTEETATEEKTSNDGTADGDRNDDADDPPPSKKQKVGNEEDQEDNTTSA